MAKTAVDSALDKILGARKKGKKVKTEQKLHEFRDLHITGHLNVRYALFQLSVRLYRVVTCLQYTTVKGH